MRRESKPLVGSDGQGVGTNAQRLGGHVYDFKWKQTPAIKAGIQIEGKGKELTWAASNTFAKRGLAC